MPKQPWLQYLNVLAKSQYNTLQFLVGYHVNVADDVAGGHGLRCLVMIAKIAVFGLHCSDGYSVISYIIWAISYISMELITLHSNLFVIFASPC